MKCLFCKREAYKFVVEAISPLMYSPSPWCGCDLPPGNFAGEAFSYREAYNLAYARTAPDERGEFLLVHEKPQKKPSWM